MKVRFLALLAACSVLAAVTAAPAAATPLETVLTPEQAGTAIPAQSMDWGYGGYGSGFGWGTPSGSGCGCPGMMAGFANPFMPWWAGQSLYTISAASGFTWPWAPFYWSPWWWTAAALSPFH